MGISNEPPKVGKDVNEYLTMVNNCTLNLNKEMCKRSISLDKHTLIR